MDVVADLDGDGLDEVAWRDDRRHDLVLWDLDAGGPDAPTFLSNSVKGWRVVGRGDFDGDGVQDLFAVRSKPDKVEVWLIDAGAIVSVVSLPLAAGPEWVAHAVGDHDRDGLSDLAWRNAQTGDVEIWFSDGDAITAVPVSNAGPSAVQSLVSGLQGTENARFHARLCNGDFDGDGMVGIPDYPHMARCLGSAASGACAAADMDSDGQVTDLDYERFQLVFGRAACVQ